MLTPRDVGLFRAFGFIVLRSCLSPQEVTELEAAYLRTMAEAPPYDYFGTSGTKLLLHFIDADPAFARLAVHPRMMDAFRSFWGGLPLLIDSDMWANLDATPWHSDGVPGRQGVTVKMTTYLDPMTAQQGALRLVPGSHHREFCTAILNHCGHWDQDRPRLHLAQEDVPGQATVELNPGDVVLWDNRMWHSAPKRADAKARRGLFIAYAPDPAQECTAIADLKRSLRDIYDETRPFVYGKGFMAHGGPTAEHMATRLEQLSGKRVRE